MAQNSEILIERVVEITRKLGKGTPLKSEPANRVLLDRLTKLTRKKCLILLLFTPELIGKTLIIGIGKNGCRVLNMINFFTSLLF